MRNEHVCELCFPQAKEIGWIASGYMLILLNDKYGIMNGQGHNEEDILYFSEKPTPDPDPNYEHEESGDPILDQAIEWTDKATELDNLWKMGITDGWHIFNACEEEFRASNYNIFYLTSEPKAPTS